MSTTATSATDCQYSTKESSWSEEKAKRGELSANADGKDNHWLDTEQCPTEQQKREMCRQSSVLQPCSRPTGRSRMDTSPSFRAILSQKFIFNRQNLKSHSATCSSPHTNNTINSDFSAPPRIHPTVTDDWLLTFKIEFYWTFYLNSHSSCWRQPANSMCETSTAERG